MGTVPEGMQPGQEEGTVLGWVVEDLEGTVPEDS